MRAKTKSSVKRSGDGWFTFATSLSSPSPLSTLSLLPPILRTPLPSSGLAQENENLGKDLQVALQERRQLEATVLSLKAEMNEVSPPQPPPLPSLLIDYQHYTTTTTTTTPSSPGD